MLIRAVVTAALRFRLLVVGAAAGLIALGLISLRQMHADVLPELSGGPVLEVQTEALGLSSQEVEQYVTVPMENNLLDGIMGVWDVRSHSITGAGDGGPVLRAGDDDAARPPARRGAADQRVLAPQRLEAAAADPAAVLDQPGADDRAALEAPSTRSSSPTSRGGW